MFLFKYHPFLFITNQLSILIGIRNFNLNEYLVLLEFEIELW